MCKICNTQRRGSEAAEWNSTISVRVQPELLALAGSTWGTYVRSGVHCHLGEVPFSECQEAPPDSTGKKKSQQKSPQHTPPSPPYSSNLQKFLWPPTHSQGNKQDLWIGIGFGHAGMQGHTTHHNLHSSRDVLVRICFRSLWCRLRALPVLAHRLFAFSAGSPRHHVYLCRCSLWRQRAEEQVRQCTPRLSAAALPWRAAGLRDERRPVALRTLAWPRPSSVHHMPSSGLLAIKGWAGSAEARLLMPLFREVLD